MHDDAANTATLPRAAEESPPRRQEDSEGEPAAGAPTERVDTPAEEAATPAAPPPPPPAVPTPTPSSPRRFGRTAVAAAAVALLAIGGLGGFAIGRATAGPDRHDQRPNLEERRLPPGFDNGTPPGPRGDRDGDRGPGFGDENGDRNGGTGT